MVHRALPPDLAAGLLLAPLAMYGVLLAFLYLGLGAFGIPVTLGMLLGAPTAGVWIQGVDHDIKCDDFV